MAPTASPAFIFRSRRCLRHTGSSAAEETTAMADAVALPPTQNPENNAASKRQNQKGYGTMGYVATAEETTNE
eukprot:11209622-Lingulodinium_polyedra.AAC.1